MRKTLVYLACPYSDPDPAVREERFHAVNRAAAFLMSRGIHVFSPISHTHPILNEGSLPSDWEYWREYDRAVLSCCRALVVLTTAGWEQSRGVQGEVEVARELHLPVHYADPDEPSLGAVAGLLGEDSSAGEDEREAGRLEFAERVTRFLEGDDKPYAAAWVRERAREVQP